MALKFIGPFRDFFFLLVIHVYSEWGEQNKTEKNSDCTDTYILFFLHLPWPSPQVFNFPALLLFRGLKKQNNQKIRPCTIMLLCFSVLGLIPETSCLPHGRDGVPFLLMWCCPCWGHPLAWQHGSDVQMSVSWCLPAAELCLLWLQEQKMFKPMWFWNVTVFAYISAW